MSAHDPTEGDEPTVGFVSGAGTGGWFKCSWRPGERFPLIAIPEEELDLPSDVWTVEVPPVCETCGATASMFTQGGWICDECDDRTDGAA